MATASVKWWTIVAYKLLPRSLQIAVCIGGFVGWGTTLAHASKNDWGFPGLVAGFAMLMLPLWPAMRLLERTKLWPDLYKEWAWLLFCVVATSPSLVALGYMQLTAR